MARKKKTKMTLAEFKTWIQGMQDAMPQDWHPTKENWALISEKIESITEPKPEVITKIEERVVSAPSHQQPQRPAAPYHPHNPANVHHNIPPIEELTRNVEPALSLQIPSEIPDLKKLASDSTNNEEGGNYESAFS